MAIFLLLLIGIYRSHLKWLWVGDCKFHPTCSEYAVDCVKHHSPSRAMTLIVWRILRCNPFAKGGLDLPPSAQSHNTTVNEIVSLPRLGYEK